MKKNTVITLAVIIILSIVFYSYFLNDYLAFKKVEKERTEASCRNYLFEFENGFYVEDVRFIEVDVVRNIYKVKEFMNNYSNSEYETRVLQIKDNLWNAEIVKYEQKAEQKRGKPKAVKFFRKLLHYMKDNSVYDIALNFESTVELKDYEDYDNVARVFLAMNANPTISEDNMLPLKSNFTQGAVSELENIVEDGIKNSLDSIFSPGFINVSTNNKKTDLVIRIKYTIKNQEFESDNIVFPEVWTYTVDDNFSSYLLGIAIDFEFNFTLPEGSYTFTEHSDPSGSIGNIEDIREGYSRMTQMTFALFSNSISNNLGLDERYN
jgi:hypothetical protein